MRGTSPCCPTRTGTRPIDRKPLQAVAAWLVARPLNATLALAATSSPFLGFLSSILIVLLVLRQGMRIAVIEAVFAGALLAAVSLLVGSPASVVIAVAIVFWVPALVLAVVMTATRSLTLTLQLSAIALLACLLAFLAAVPDQVSFWEPYVADVADRWREQGAVEFAELLLNSQAQIAAEATKYVASTFWSIYAATFVLGYLLYRQLPGDPATYGRFRELNFGRVIAGAMALCSVAGMLVGAEWVQDAAFVLFAVFWLQGLALVHWMHGQGQLPLFAVIAMYVVMLFPLLGWITFIALAVTGYIDAWFRLRRLTLAT